MNIVVKFVGLIEQIQKYKYRYAIQGLLMATFTLLTWISLFYLHIQIATEHYFTDNTVQKIVEASLLSHYLVIAGLCMWFMFIVFDCLTNLKMERSSQHYEMIIIYFVMNPIVLVCCALFLLGVIIYFSNKPQVLVQQKA